MIWATLLQQPILLEPANKLAICHTASRWLAPFVQVAFRDPLVELSEKSWQRAKATTLNFSLKFHSRFHSFTRFWWLMRAANKLWGFDELQAARLLGRFVGRLMSSLQVASIQFGRLFSRPDPMFCLYFERSLLCHLNCASCMPIQFSFEPIRVCVSSSCPCKLTNSQATLLKTCASAAQVR